MIVVAKNLSVLQYLSCHCGSLSGTPQAFLCFSQGCHVLVLSYLGQQQIPTINQKLINENINGATLQYCATVGIPFLYFCLATFIVDFFQVWILQLINKNNNKNNDSNHYNQVSELSSHTKVLFLLERIKIREEVREENQSAWAKTKNPKLRFKK